MDPSNRIDDGTERKLDPRAVTLGRIGGAIGAGVLAAVSFVGLLVVLFATGPALPVALTLVSGWIGLVALAAVFALVWPRLVWKYASYKVGAWGIEIRRGVVVREVVTVPRSRVQHTDVSQGPIERQFGLATLILHTAGTHHAAVPLEGLDHGTAVRIRDHFVATSLDDAV
jgi:membrane protein YdbS with pleckstrin-like domain